MCNNLFMCLVLLYASSCCLHLNAVSIKTRLAYNHTIPPHHSSNNNNNYGIKTHIHLPRGFKPQSPPQNPMLYPFVNEPITPSTQNSPILLNPSSTSNWKPMIMSTNVPITPVHVQTRHSQTTADSSAEGPVFESVVYGIWQAPPQRPDLIANRTLEREKNVRFRVAGNLEHMLSGANSK